jgi:intracellular sulfur oxidation DsrE/DsrF family protein
MNEKEDKFHNWFQSIQNILKENWEEENQILYHDIDTLKIKQKRGIFQNELKIVKSQKLKFQVEGNYISMFEKQYTNIIILVQVELRRS